VPGTAEALWGPENQSRWEKGVEALLATGPEWSLTPLSDTGL
jgi:hypothetical protein